MVWALQALGISACGFSSGFRVLWVSVSALGALQGRDLLAVRVLPV